MATAPVGAAQADGWTAATLHASPPFFPVSAGTSLNPKGLLSTTAAWKRAQQQGVEDARRALQPDTRTPFASFEDAAQRLLPYHVFATEEGDEQDTDELGACSRGLRVTRVFVTDSTRGVHPHSDAAGERRAGEPRRAVAGHVCAQGAGLQSRGRKVRRRGVLLSPLLLATAPDALVPCCDGARPRLQTRRVDRRVRGWAGEPGGAATRGALHGASFSFVLSFVGVTSRVSGADMWCLSQSVETGGAHDLRGDAVQARAGEAAVGGGQGASPTVADAAGEACAMGAGRGSDTHALPCGCCMDGHTAMSWLGLFKRGAPQTGRPKSRHCGSRHATNRVVVGHERGPPPLASSACPPSFHQWLWCCPGALCPSSPPPSPAPPPLFLLTSPQRHVAQPWSASLQPPPRAAFCACATASPSAVFVALHQPLSDTVMVLDAEVSTHQEPNAPISVNSSVTDTTCASVHAPQSSTCMPDTVLVGSTAASRRRATLAVGPCAKAKIKALWRRASRKDAKLSADGRVHAASARPMVAPRHGAQVSRRSTRPPMAMSLMKRGKSQMGVHVQLSTSCDALDPLHEVRPRLGRRHRVHRPGQGQRQRQAGQRVAAQAASVPAGFAPRFGREAQAAR